MGITMIKFLLKAWDDIEAYQDHSAKFSKNAFKRGVFNETAFELKSSLP